MTISNFARIGALAATFAASSAFAQDVDQSIIVLDASGSMWGQIEGEPKITIARRVISDILQDFPEDQAIGLSAYGHNRKGDCSDIELLVAPAIGNAAAIQAAVAAISPKGKTPIADAVLGAAKQLRSEEEPATVILISDGIETCDRNPCAVAAELEKSGIDFTTHVIGFDINSREEGEQLACLADETGGKYLAASNAVELGEALETVAETLSAPESEPVEVALVEQPSSNLILSDKKPGKELSAATMIDPMEALDDRIGEGGTHYWKVSLTPGLFQFVFDLERADDKFTYTSLDIDFLQTNGVSTEQQLRPNGNYIRQRYIKTLEIPAPMEIVIALSDAKTVLDYDMSVVPIEEQLPIPYMDRSVDVQQVTLGEKAISEISGVGHEQGEAWHRVFLEAKDYEFLVEFEHKAGDDSYNRGQAMIYGENGEVLQNKPLCSASGPKAIVTCSARLSLAEERDFYVRMMSPAGEPYDTGLTVREID